MAVRAPAVATVDDAPERSAAVDAEVPPAANEEDAAGARPVAAEHTGAHARARAGLAAASTAAAKAEAQSQARAAGAEIGARTRR